PRPPSPAARHRRHRHPELSGLRHTPHTSPPRPFLFFKEHGAPRDLHSFPTRRSSDLDIRIGIEIHGEITRTGAAALPVLVISPRSEEHTSELQSLTNLVCRLLLEKKKVAPSARGDVTDTR